MNIYLENKEYNMKKKIHFFIFILQLNKLLDVNIIGEKHFLYVLIVKNLFNVVFVTKFMLIMIWIEQKQN